MKLDSRSERVCVWFWCARKHNIFIFRLSSRVIRFKPSVQYFHGIAIAEIFETNLSDFCCLIYSTNSAKLRFIFRDVKWIINPLISQWLAEAFRKKRESKNSKFVDRSEANLCFGWLILQQIFLDSEYSACAKILERKKREKKSRRS